MLAQNLYILKCGFIGTFNPLPLHVSFINTNQVRRLSLNTIISAMVAFNIGNSFKLPTMFTIHGHVLLANGIQNEAYF